MRAVIDLVTDGEQKIIVLSAMSGTTNSLVEISNYLHKKNKDTARIFIGKLEDKYKQVVAELFTSDDNKAIIPDAFDAGVSDYLPRPFDRSEFMARVQNLLSLRQTTLQLEDDKRTLEHRITKATKDLQESEQRFRLALDGTQDGIWDWNLETEDVFYSENWCSMLGYKKEDVPTLPAFWMGRLNPDDAYILTAAIDNHIMGKSDVIDCE